MNRASPSKDSFSVRLQKSIESAKGPRKDDIYVISNALWFEMIRSELDLPSAYAVEQHLEPHAIHPKGDGTVNHDCNWAKYAIGNRGPRSARVEKVEIEVPGTARLLKHPLWNILRKPALSVIETEVWIRTLDGDVQAILLRKNQHRNPDMTVSGPVVSKAQLDMLKRRAGLDSLAALVILARKATRQGQSDTALKICDYIYQVLLITCLLSPFRLLVREMFDCFQRRVFSGIQHNDIKIDVVAFDCKAFVELLDYAVRHTRNKPQFGNQKRHLARTCCALLDARNPDVYFALAAPRVNAAMRTSRSGNGLEDSDLNRAWGIRKMLGLTTENIAFSRQNMRQSLAAEPPRRISLASGGVLLLHGHSIHHSP